MPSLQASDDSNKSVRMVSIMVLVQIYKLIGDDIWAHLHDINQHKVRLHNIKSEFSSF